MNTYELPAFAQWDEKELTALVGAYVRLFRRLPSPTDLLQFERARDNRRRGLEPPRGQRSADLHAV